MNNIENLNQRVLVIEQRNRRVEADKAWETSFARKVVIGLLTYITISSFMVIIEVRQPLLNALVPTGGFILSTLTLPWIKSIWLRSQKKL